MNVKITTWRISTLYSKKSSINEQPNYQRGEVWNDKKKALLIDSILRGVDIPKIYLRELVNRQYDYEVADGQQRIHSIVKFKDNSLKLLDQEEKGLNLSEINGHIIGGKMYKDLPATLRDKFDSYDVTIAVVKGATDGEIRTLFGRLQEGSSLNPAEKRNALLSQLHNPTDNFCFNHSFFLNCKIPSGRFKHQDYLAHGIALIKYGNQSDLKAGLLQQLYLDKSINLTSQDEKTISDVLDALHQIDGYSSVRIHKKYNFIDLFWFLYKNHNKLSHIRHKKIAEKYDHLEWDRMKHHANPGVLINKINPSKYEGHLYRYCIAFRYEGARVKNINERQKFYSFNYQDLL
ncbi:MAG: DUF262 domain-containing protein [Cyclobacteriaceae bacterium]